MRVRNKAKLYKTQQINNELMKTFARRGLSGRLSVLVVPGYAIIHMLLIYSSSIVADSDGLIKLIRCDCVTWINGLIRTANNVCSMYM